MTLKNAIIQRFSDLCDEQNMTLNDLRATGGVSRSGFDQFFNGHHKTIRVSTVETLCHRLGISLADFFCCDLFVELDPEDDE